MANQIVWFDLAVRDLDRAIRFYSAILGAELHREEMPGVSIAVLPHQGDEVSGCLYLKAGDEPSSGGPLLYFNVQGRLDQAIAQVEPGGGRILQAKHAIGAFGFRSIVEDSEGNRIALHSM